jgi:hypothetical protein
VLTGQPQGFSETNNAQRFVVGPKQANLRGRNFPVQMMLPFFTLAAIAKYSSDG